jgi:hypothetical protein
VARYSRLYRLIARAFPHSFRAVCGDGLEQLGADILPLVWQKEGILGLIRCFADLALRLPLECLSAWGEMFKECIMTDDPFEGTWKAMNEKSQWDPACTPEQACLRFEATETGYLLVAYGIKDGQAVAERPRPIIPDGRRRPVVDLNGRPIPGIRPGTLAYETRPDMLTIEAGAEVDGQVLGRGTYRISDDGQTLTVTTEGEGLNGPFKTFAVFERVTPDPYEPA